MLSHRLLIVFASLLLSFTTCQHAKLSGFTWVNPSSDSLRYTGRVHQYKDSVIIYWPATVVEIRFKGTGLKAMLKDERGANYFNVVIDGDSVHHIRIDKDKGLHTLAEDLEDDEHVVQLVKRSEWDQGKTIFYGMAVTGTLLSPPPSNKRIIEFYGDSITAGYAIDDATGSDSPEGTNTNSYYTYAALTARHFNADSHAIVKSGIGITISWFPLTMPEMYNRIDPTDSASRWDFQQVQPQVVVINLFQNDSWLVNKPNHSSFIERFENRKPEEKQIVDAYQSFVEKIREVYPEAYIICALGSMDAVRKGSPWPGYIAAAADRLHDKKVLTHFFPYQDSKGHPNRKENQLMAESLIRFIESNVTW